MLKRLVVAVFILVGVVTVAAVTRGAAGVPQDLDALTTIVQNGFAAIQNSLSNIQTSLNDLSALLVQSNVRITPPVVVTSATLDSALCEVVNVSGAAQTVQAQLVGGDGSVLEDTGDISLAAGHEMETASVPGTDGGLRVYCKFTAVGGSRTDIRGTLAVFTDSNSDKLSVPAE